jgi:hypothetical protein
MTSLPHTYHPDEFFQTMLPAWYDTSDKNNFPAYLGANHAGINTRGPLKNDWTKSCPLEWTQMERDEKCVPLQEIIWGTKILRRLEAIKEAIDPNYMFDCTGCVGNDRPKATSPTSSSAASSKCPMALACFIAFATFCMFM